MNKEDSRFMAELLGVLEESEPWAKRVSSGASGLESAPRSPMWGDDDRLQPYEMSLTRAAR
jgi:hypothetical protein